MESDLERLCGWKLLWPNLRFWPSRGSIETEGNNSTTQSGRRAIPIVDFVVLFGGDKA